VVDGGLDVRWIHGAPDCARSADPPLQVHRYDGSTVIMRQSKCSHFEAPFLYLLVGRERALLVDTGAAPSAGPALPLRAMVDGILAAVAAEAGRAPPELIVAHSHGHDDHAANDGQFEGRPHTTIVAPPLDAVRSFFGLSRWPEGSAVLDLGERPVRVLPTPGHEPSHVMLYDERTGLLLSGDMLYPGLLTVRDWPAYRASAARLAAFADAHAVRYVLGGHVEMQRTPGALYPLGTTFQPEEHVLQLDASQVGELHAACERLGDRPSGRVVHDHFAIEIVR
jgi:hydroxyacylglutathione hydrolase